MWVKGKLGMKNSTIEKIQTGALAIACAGIMAATGAGIKSQVVDNKAEQMYWTTGYQSSYEDMVKVTETADQIKQDAHNWEIVAGLGILAATAGGFAYMGADLAKEIDFANDRFETRSRQAEAMEAGDDPNRDRVDRERAEREQADRERVERNRERIIKDFIERGE